MALIFVLVTFIDPEVIVTFGSETLPKDDTVLPKVTAVLPIVEELLPKKLFGNVVATLDTVVFVSVTLPKLVTVLPKVTVVFPIIAELFESPELGIVKDAVTGEVLLAYI